MITNGRLSDLMRLCGGTVHVAWLGIISRVCRYTHQLGVSLHYGFPFADWRRAWRG